MVLHREAVLVTEEDHLPLQQGLPQLLGEVVTDRLREVDTADLGTDVGVSGQMPRIRYSVSALPGAVRSRTRRP